MRPRARAPTRHLTHLVIVRDRSPSLRWIFMRSVPVRLSWKNSFVSAACEIAAVCRFSVKPFDRSPHPEGSPATHPAGTGVLNRTFDDHGLASVPGRGHDGRGTERIGRPRVRRAHSGPCATKRGVRADSGARVATTRTHAKHHLIHHSLIPLQVAVGGRGRSGVEGSPLAMCAPRTYLPRKRSPSDRCA